MKNGGATGEEDGESARRRELRLFNCLLGKLIKSILREAEGVHATRELRPIYTVRRLTSVLYEQCEMARE